MENGIQERIKNMNLERLWEIFSINQKLAYEDKSPKLWQPRFDQIIWQPGADGRGLQQGLEAGELYFNYVLSQIQGFGSPLENLFSMEALFYSHRDASREESM